MSTYKNGKNEISKRIRHFRHALNLKQGEMAKIGSLNASYLSNVERGRVAVSLNLLTKITKAWPNINGDWLLHGRGPMLMGDVFESGAATPDVVKVPLLPVEASAGPGAFVEGEQVEIDSLPMPRAFVEKLDVPLKSLHFITAVGDSMAPTMSDGALLLVSTYMQGLSAGIYAMTLDDAVLVKRLQVGLGSLTLTSDNSVYRDIVIDNPKDANLNIAGRVVWIGNKV